MNELVKLDPDIPEARPPRTCQLHQLSSGHVHYIMWPYLNQSLNPITDNANCPSLGQLSILTLGVWICINKLYRFIVPKENQDISTRKQVNGWWVVGNNKYSLPTERQ